MAFGQSVNLLPDGEPKVVLVKNSIAGIHSLGAYNPKRPVVKKVKPYVSRDPIPSLHRE